METSTRWPVGAAGDAWAAGERMVAVGVRHLAGEWRPMICRADEVACWWQRLAGSPQTPLLMWGVVRPVPQREVVMGCGRGWPVPDAVLIELGSLDGDAVAAMRPDGSATPSPRRLQCGRRRAGGNRCGGELT